MPRNSRTTDAPPEAMRLDKLFFYLRFYRSRALATAAIARHGERIDGRRTAKPGALARSGDQLTFALGRRVMTIEITALPARRGPAAEAQSCYRHLGTEGEPAMSSGDITK